MSNYFRINFSKVFSASFPSLPTLLVVVAFIFKQHTNATWLSLQFLTQKPRLEAKSNLYLHYLTI